MNLFKISKRVMTPWLSVGDPMFLVVNASVSIARAFSLDPKILILDDSTSAGRYQDRMIWSVRIGNQPRLPKSSLVSGFSSIPRCRAHHRDEWWPNRCDRSSRCLRPMPSAQEAKSNTRERRSRWKLKKKANLGSILRLLDFLWKNTRYHDLFPLS